MTDCSIDAIIIAKAIQKDDISFLRGKEFKMRDKMKNKKGRAHPGVNTVKTSRLDKIEESITKLAEEMRAGFKQVNSQIDNLETRIDRIDARLDYNGLKKLPINK